MRFLLSFGCFCCLAYAQWATPVVDGIIGSGEYGLNNQLNNAGGTAQTWYMTWDASNLYVGITNANLSEGAVIYIGGVGPVGNLTGFNYDGASFSSLPFQAQFVTYFKDGYREYRRQDGAGGWTAATAFYGSYASNGSGNVREVAIPWSAVTGGGMPGAFTFFGYLVSSGGYVYGQAPSDNAGAFIGTSATYTQYFSVLNTGNGTSTPPFSLTPLSSCCSSCSEKPASCSLLIHSTRLTDDGANSRKPRSFTSGARPRPGTMRSRP